MTGCGFISAFLQHTLSINQFVNVKSAYFVNKVLADA